MENHIGVSASQTRAARALLNWSQEDLADASGLSIATIRKIELGNISPRFSTTNEIRQALEIAGLEFIEPDGVRRRQDDINAFQGENGMVRFFEDMKSTINNGCNDIVFITSLDESSFPLGIDEHFNRLKQIADSTPNVTIKCLLVDNYIDSWSKYNFEIRTISKCYIESIPYYAYGEKYAMLIPGRKSSSKIIVIESSMAAETAKRQFYSIWEKAILHNPQIAPINKVMKLSSC